MADFNEEQKVTTEDSRVNSFWYGFKRFIWFIAITSVLCGVIGAVVAKIKDKNVYTATSSVMMVAEIADASDTTNVSLSKKIMPSVSALIKSVETIQTANEIYIENHGAQGNPAISVKSVKVSYGDDSLIIRVSYSDYSEKAAESKLNAVIASAKKMLTSGKKLPVNVLSLEPLQNTPDKSVSNSFWKYVLVGFGAGLVLSFGASLVIKALDTSIRSKKEVEELCGVSLLSCIEDVKE